MSKLTFESLYAARCYGDKPVFWKPEPLKTVEFTLFGDDDLPVEESWGVHNVVQRIIAASLRLELPVGSWITETRKTINSISPVVNRLLMANVADESAHFKAFSYAAEAYPVSQQISNEADLIANQWLENNEHPLQKSAILEAGTFLISLALLRVASGSELSNLSNQTSRDESRHVATNRGVLAATGYNPSKPSQSLSKLTESTLDWILDGLCIPSDSIGESFNLDKDFLMKSSKSLIETGQAKELDNVIYFGDQNSPMEMKNTSVYSRTTETPTEVAT